VEGYCEKEQHQAHQTPNKVQKLRKQKSLTDIWPLAIKSV